jgi:hypothetical protein
MKKKSKKKYGCAMSWCSLTTFPRIMASLRSELIFLKKGTYDFIAMVKFSNLQPDIGKGYIGKGSTDGHVHKYTRATSSFGNLDHCLEM